MKTLAAAALLIGGATLATGCSSPSDTATPAPAIIAPSESQAAAPDLPERWLGNWCAVKKGMGRSEAVALMGEPMTEYGPKYTAYPQLAWEEDANSYVAFQDTDGVLTQLQGNYDRLGASDKAKLTCPEVR